MKILEDYIQITQDEDRSQVYGYALEKGEKVFLCDEFGNGMKMIGMITDCFGNSIILDSVVQMDCSILADVVGRPQMNLMGKILITPRVRQVFRIRETDHCAENESKGIPLDCPELKKPLCPDGYFLKYHRSNWYLFPNQNVMH